MVRTARNLPASPAGQILVKGAWDSKKPVDPLIARTIFGFMELQDGDGNPVDPNDLIERQFKIIGADENRMYLEEVKWLPPAAAKAQAKKRRKEK